MWQLFTTMEFGLLGSFGQVVKTVDKKYPRFDDTDPISLEADHHGFASRENRLDRDGPAAQVVQVLS